MRRLAREKVRPESSSCSAPLNTRYGTSSEDGSAVGSGRHRGRQSASAVGPGRVRRGAQESGAVASALVQYRLPEGGVRGGIPAAGSVLPLWGIPEHLRRLGHQTWTSSSCPPRGPPRQRPAAGGTGGGSAPFRPQEESEAVGPTPPPAPDSARRGGRFLPCPDRAQHRGPSSFRVRPRVHDTEHENEHENEAVRTRVEGGWDPFSGEVRTDAGAVLLALSARSAPRARRRSTAPCSWPGRRVPSRRPAW